MSRGLRFATGAEVRAASRAGVWDRPTSGLAPGYVQANLVMLPGDLADDFERFCRANPIACPLLERTAPGTPEPVGFAPGADVRRDAPRYRVYLNGESAAGEPHDVLRHWTDDMVAFLIGCSFTFEAAMLRAGLPLRHVESGCNVPMYRTSRLCQPRGVFHGPMVVSMRPIASRRVAEARRVTGRFPRMHGAPVHVGDPSALGIAHLDRPDWGDPVEIRQGEEPVFWGCGVTPQAVAIASRPALMLTHAPGHMFVTDRRDAEFEEPDTA